MKLFENIIKRTRTYRELVVSSSKRATDLVLSSNKLAADLSDRDRKVRELSKELDILKERIPAITDKLVRVSLQRKDNPLPVLRICMEVDVDNMCRGLLHGNDMLVIDYIGEYVGTMVAEKIKAGNYRRWEV
jgi:seryl-tRNA synthetase